jgi:molybdate transport system ATP-binding protein
LISVDTDPRAKERFPGCPSNVRSDHPHVTEKRHDVKEFSAGAKLMTVVINADNSSIICCNHINFVSKPSLLANPIKGKKSQLPLKVQLVHLRETSLTDDVNSGRKEGEATMETQKLISLKDVSVRLRDTIYLKNISWEIGHDEQWAILGPNGSGKSTLVKALFGQVPVVGGKVVYHLSNSGISEKDHSKIAYVASDAHRDLIQRSILEDTFRDFSGRIQDFTSVRTVLLERVDAGDRSRRDEERAVELARRMGIEHLLERPIDSISIGESRKLLIARALLKKPKLLILDKPFDGLDQNSAKSLERILKKLMEDGARIVLITNRIEEILEPITHVLIMQEGKIVASGEKSELLAGPVEAHLGSDTQDFDIEESLYEEIKESGQLLDSEMGLESFFIPDTLVQMKNVAVKYDDVVVIDRFDWTVRSGENWAIFGPNGAGKSTLLKLILGENQQAYANDIWIWGRKKGTDLSVWDIWKHIGYVSADLQAKYRAETRVFDVVCSGFHDSVGLYRRCSDLEKKVAGLWLRLLRLDAFAGKRFNELSFGQRQLLLVARAMVKKPLVLILDEPCDGLDANNRAKLLKIVDWMAEKTGVTVLFTTHCRDEIPGCIQNTLILEKGKVADIRRRRQCE